MRQGRTARRTDAGILLAFFAITALFLYWPAHLGPFVSDDLFYVAFNPYVHSLTVENLLAILHPRGTAAMYTANYAPVHLLGHALEWHHWGDRVFGYHIVNVLLHAATAALLVALLPRYQVPRKAALVIGVLFLVHPANVESVAWIFQMKTILGLGLAIGALFLLREHPAWASLLFALALLSKISAAFALPVAATALWCRGDGSRKEWIWVGVWLGLLLLVALPEFTHFRRFTYYHAYSDGMTQLRSIVAIAGRYLVMASTSMGVSAFHEPAPTDTWLDRWFLIGLVLLVLLGWRTATTLWRRSPEAIFWVWAIAAWAPISQVFPFLYPIGDRYLYFVLPGLLGGAYFLGRDLVAELAARVPTAPTVQLRRVGLVTLSAAAIAFAAHSRSRAELWASPELLHLDTVRNYPEGNSAALENAHRALQRGDIDAANAYLMTVARRGYDDFRKLQSEAAFRPLHGTPGFREAVALVAANWIAAVAPRGSHSQGELRYWALAHWSRQEFDLALRKYEAAIALGGFLDEDLLRAEMAQVRNEKRRLERGGHVGPQSGQAAQRAGEALAPRFESQRR